MTQFQRGDIVIHPRRPEWGSGTVDQATTILHDGKNVQRLVVKFANEGVVTINTGIAALLRKDSHSAMDSSNSTTGTKSAPNTKGPGWLGNLNHAARKHGEELYALPDGMTDPFQSIPKRLQATLDSYRYGTDARNARNILEWAMGQTNLNDPLSKYTRSELEQAFPRFLRDRDNHLFEMVKQLKRASRLDILQETLKAQRLPAAREALQKAINR